MEKNWPHPKSFPRYLASEHFTVHLGLCDGGDGGGLRGGLRIVTFIQSKVHALAVHVLLRHPEPCSSQSEGTREQGIEQYLVEPSIPTTGL